MDSNGTPTPRLTGPLSSVISSPTASTTKMPMRLPATTAPPTEAHAKSLHQPITEPRLREMAATMVGLAVSRQPEHMTEAVRLAGEYITAAPRDPWMAATFVHWASLVESKETQRVLRPLAQAALKPGVPALILLLYTAALHDDGQVEEAITQATRAVERVVEITKKKGSRSKTAASPMRDTIDNLISADTILNCIATALYLLGGSDKTGERLVEHVVSASIQDAAVRVAQSIVQVSTLPPPEHSTTSTEAAVERALYTCQLLEEAHRLYPFANYARDVASTALAGFYAYTIASGDAGAASLLLNATGDAQARWPEDVKIACYRIACMDHRRRQTAAASSEDCQVQACDEILRCYYVGSRAADGLGQCQSMDMFYSECVSRGVQWAFSRAGIRGLGVVYSRCVLIYRIAKTVKAVGELCAAAVTKLMAEDRRLNEIMSCAGAAHRRQLTARKSATARALLATEEALRVLITLCTGRGVSDDIQEWTRALLAVISDCGEVIMKNAPRADVAVAEVHVRELRTGLMAYMESGGEEAYTAHLREEPDYAPK